MTAKRDEMNQGAGPQPAAGRSAWQRTLRLVACWAAVVVAATAVAGHFMVRRANELGQAFMPPGMAAAQYARGDTVGDLGGVPVTIPKHFAEFVEYESDPRWSEGRTTERGPVTHASKLVSFGFYLRYPDMAGESTPELRADKRNQPISTTTWLNVGITTGKHFPGTGFMDRLLSHLNDPGKLQHAAVADPWNGLTVYEPIDVDPKTQVPWRDHRDGDRVYVHRDATGAVDVYIKCSNRPYESATCQQEFSLEPKMKALVYVTYRRGLLPHWQEIQSSVARVVLSFEEPASASNTP